MAPHVVNNSAMPDVNCQHLVALALVKGAVSFDDSHSRPLMQDPAILAVRRRSSSSETARWSIPRRRAAGSSRSR